MRRRLAAFVAAVVILITWTVTAKIRVHPQKVNVNVNGATTTLLTFGHVTGFVPGEAVWCGEVGTAAPDIGVRPVPGTIFGTLPSRFDLSTFSGSGGLTDIMSIPPSVARRAYQAAAAGERSTFFYVRRFISMTGGRDQYVAVTCELAGGGARTPFALKNVSLVFDNQMLVAAVTEGEDPPALEALLSYNGTGQLQGRWEIVRPGDELPSERDLLTQATLPMELRPLQRRYTELERFSVFLPPTGKYLLRGPDPSKMPSTVRGLYMVLLRIECTPDIEAKSRADEVGAEPGPVEAGGTAGFSIPPLRYFVGGGVHPQTHGVHLLSPRDLAVATRRSPVSLVWREIGGSALHRVVVIDPSNSILLMALLRPGSLAYAVPPWIWDKTEAGSIAWSIECLDDNGEVRTKSEWRTIVRSSDRP
jgi:hypothetical protein